MLNNCRAAFSLLNVIVCPVLLYALLSGELSHWHYKANKSAI